MDIYFTIAVVVIAVYYLFPMSETFLKPVTSIIGGVLWPISLLWFLWIVMLGLVEISTIANRVDKNERYIDTTEMRLLT